MTIKEPRPQRLTNATARAYCTEPVIGAQKLSRQSTFVGTHAPLVSEPRTLTATSSSGASNA